MKKNVCKCFLILLLFVFSNQLLASQYTLNSTIGSFGAVSETGNSHLIVSGGQTTNQQSANQGYTLLAGNIFRTNLSIEVPTIVYPPNHKIMYRYNISFDWTDINNAASYDFELFGTSLCNTTSSQYTIELTTGTYQWRVRAMLNDVIKSSWTETMEVIVTTSNYNPIIFVHGRQLVNSRGFNALDYWRGKPDSEFEDTTAMTKIITGKYQDYIAGKLECNYQTTQDDLYTSIASTDNKNKTIWNFTYYGNDCGVIGSNGNLSATGVEGVAYYADHSSGVQVPFGLPAGLVYSTALTSGGSQAERLANFIDKVLDVTGTEKVNIVAHSLGGLVSRSAIKWYGCNTKVKKLITIGTPNQGADYSVFEYLMGGYGDFPYGEDLETFRFNKFSNGSREDTFTNFLNEGNPGDWAGGVKYATIAGTRSPLPWGRNINKIEINYTIRDDCLFNTEWVELPGAEFNAITYASHGTSINGNMDTYIPLTSIKAEMTVGPIIGENSLTSCNYTTDIIRCWIMDDINPFIYKETGESQRSYLFSTSPEIVKIRTQFEPMGPALWGIPCEVRADINFKNSFNKNKYIWLTVTCNSWDTNNGTEEVTRVYDSTGNIVGCTVKANTYWIYTSSISSEGYWYPVEPSKMKFSYTIAGEVVDSSVDKFQYVYGPIEYKDLNFETYGTESVPITAILNVGDSNYEIYKIDRIPLSDYNGNYSSTTVIFSTYVCINISLDPKPIGPSSGKIQLQQSAAEYKYRIFLYTRKSNPSQDIEISSPTVDSIKPRSRVNTPSNYFVNAATFTVMWTGIDDYSGIKCYHIEYSTDNFNTWQLWSIESTSWTYLTTSTFNVTGLTSDTTIYFRSRAEDYAGNLEDWGAQTDYDCYAVIDLTPPSTVQLLSPPNNGYDNHNNGYAVFDWQDSTDDRLAYYELQVDTMPDMSNASIVSIEESEFNLFIYDYYGQNYGLDDGRYYWRVRAKDAAGNTSPWSTTWSFIIDPTCPVTTGSLEVSKLDGTWISTNSWTNTLTPSVRIGVQEAEPNVAGMVISGLLPSSAGFQYKTNGSNWMPEMDGFEYISDPQARVNWQPHEDAGEVSISTTQSHGGARAMVLPCNFTGGQDKAYWDHLFSEVDLSDDEYISFWLYLPTGASSTIETVSLYMKSGTGWYYASSTTSPSLTPGWNQYTFYKTEFSSSTYGTPTGWEHITGMRLMFIERAAQDIELVIDAVSPTLPAPSPAECTGTAGTTAAQVFTAENIPINMETISDDYTQVRIFINDLAGNQQQSDYSIKIDTNASTGWADYMVTNTNNNAIDGTLYTNSLTPHCMIKNNDILSGLDPSYAGYKYSTDSGNTWQLPYTDIVITTSTPWIVHANPDDVLSVENGELTVNARQNEYAHVSYPINKQYYWLECAIKPTSSSGNSWNPGLVLYWSTSTWARVSIDETGVLHAGARNIDWYTVNGLTLNQWYYVRIKLEPTTIVFEYSQDAQTWANIGTLTRSVVYGYNKPPSELILGKGYEDTDTYTSAHLDNNSATLGSTGNSYIKELRMYSSELGAACSGTAGSTTQEEITTEAIPFTTAGEQNKVKFCIRDTAGNYAESQAYTVNIDTTPPAGWQNFKVQRNSGNWVENRYWVDTATPSCKIEVQDTESGLNTASAGFIFSTDGGQTWPGEINKFEYTDNNSAQADWAKEFMSASGDVYLSTSIYKEGTRALVFPCQFIPVEETTACWTSMFSSTSDLSMCDTFSMWLNIPDKNLIDSIVLYFNSSDGWYYQEKDIDTNNDITNGWNRLIFSQVSFSTSSYGGTPIGWHNINGIRFRVYGTTTTYVNLIVDEIKGYRSASCSGSAGYQTVTANSVPFNNEYSNNLIRFFVYDNLDHISISPDYVVHIATSVPVTYPGFELKTSTDGWVSGDTNINVTTPTARIQVQDYGYGLDTNAAGYLYSTDGGNSWYGYANDFEYINNAAIQASWPAAGSATEVRISTTVFREGNTALEAQCNFGTYPDTTAIVTTTFSTAKDFSNYNDYGYWVFVPTKTYVNEIQFRLKSGTSGWYEASYDVVEDTSGLNNWTYIVFKATEFVVVGSTAGWNNIDGIEFIIYPSTTSGDTAINIDFLAVYQSAECDNSFGTKELTYVTAEGVPFNQYSNSDNKVMFLVRNINSQLGISDIYTIKTSSNSQLYGAQMLHNREFLDPTFKLGQVYSFPNPAKGGKNPVLHIEVGIADKVDVGIYNIAGELIYTTSLDGSAWDVVNNKYCYEHKWDSGGYASGVYIYLIKAHKSGYDDIKAVKKLAVIK